MATVTVASRSASLPVQEDEMAITLYDLAAADPAVRFSPYCWRTKFALAHKGLEVETLPWHFTETARLAFSGQARVPVIVDGANVVSDSWAIAVYLDRTYPDRPGLLGGAAGEAHAAFINGWANMVMNVGISRLIVADILPALRSEDQAYFRQSRERAFGHPLDEVIAGRDQRVVEWRLSLAPLRWVLSRQPWLGGDAPDYADYIVLGTLQWPRCISRFALLDQDDPVRAWRDRGLALFDGLGARAPTV
jgi:glutathione S-transferase